MAGYPVGLWNSMGKKGFEIFHLLLPWVSLPRLFYGVIVSLCIITPLLVWLALRRRCGSVRCSSILFALSLVLWHLGTQIAYFWGFGNIFFPTAACLVVLMCAALQGIIDGPRQWLKGVVLGVLAAAAFYFHTVVLVAAAPALLAVLLMGGAGRTDRRARASIGLSLAVFALLIVWWLVPLLGTRDDCLAQPKQWFQGGPKHLVMDMFSDRAYQQHFDRNFLFQFAVVAGLAGTWIAWRQTGNRLMAALGVGGICSLAITYGAPFVAPFRAIQPYRFVIPTTLLFLGPAAVAADAGVGIFLESGRRVRVLAAVLGVLLVPRFTAYLIDQTWPRGDVGVTDVRRQVIEEVKTMQVQGRILCDDVGLGHILPYFCDVPVLSGLSSQAFLKHRFAGIDEEGILFGRKPGEWEPAELLEYLQAYAVEYAILSTRPWLRFARRSDSPFVEDRTIAGQTLFRVRDAQPGYALQGEADITAAAGRIEVKNATGPVVLKFHYADWLTGGEGVSLKAVHVLDDPVPFIRADPDPGVREFVISKR